MHGKEQIDPSWSKPNRLLSRAGLGRNDEVVLGEIRETRCVPAEQVGVERQRVAADRDLGAVDEVEVPGRRLRRLKVGRRCGRTGSESAAWVAVEPRRASARAEDRYDFARSHGTTARPYSDQTPVRQGGDGGALQREQFGVSRRDIQ